MFNQKNLFIFGMVCVMAATAPADVSSRTVTVLSGGHAIAVEQTLSDPNDLWVTPGDLTRINGFVLKPEGVCLDDICIPARRDEDSDLVVTREGQAWVSVTELARKLKQAYVSDPDTGVWSFGAIPATRTAFLESAMAPDFELPNHRGEMFRLSDLRGKKVLLMTWASW